MRENYHISETSSDLGVYNNQKCNICGTDLIQLIDFGEQPLANNYIPSPDHLVESFPLELLACTQCTVAQLSYSASRDLLYSDYFYETPLSQKLKEHYDFLISYLDSSAKLSNQSRVLEIGSNNGAFLKQLQPKVNIVLGVDPAQRIAQEANLAGIPTIPRFFDYSLAREIKEKHKNYDLIIARHCMAHNRDLFDIMKGIEQLLSKTGTLIIENSYWPHVLNNRLFDQVYHEHIYYHTVRSIQYLIKTFGFIISDILPIRLQGGSLIFIIERESRNIQINSTVQEFIDNEAFLTHARNYDNFKESVGIKIKCLRKVLNDIVSSQNIVYAYGASAKASTLINLLRLTNAEIPYVVDSTRNKQGKYLPKSNIKIISEIEAQKNPPDYYLLTIWNYADEIIEKIKSTHDPIPQIIIPHPEVRIIKP